MGQVQAPFARQQELTPNGSHAVVEGDGITGGADYFGGHQTGRSPANDDSSPSRFCI